MPSYFNPSSMFGGLTQGNPLQNAMAGARFAYEQKQADDDIQARQLELMANLNKYQQDVADNPLKDAERQTKMALAGADKELIDSGEYRRKKVADTDNVVAQTKNHEQDAITKENNNRGNWLVDLDQKLDEQPINGLAGQDEWDKYVKEGAKLGVKLPPTLDDYTRKMIKAKAKAFVMNAETQRTMAKENQKSALHYRDNTAPTIASNESIHALDRESRERIAKEGGDGRRDVAETNAAARMNSQVPRTMAAVAASALNKAAKGEPVSETEQNVAAEVAWIDRISKDINTKLAAINDPSLQSKFEEEYKRRMFNNTKPQATSPEAAPPNLPKADTTGKYDAATEAKIANVMASNKGASREAVIKALKRDGKIQ